MRAWPCQHRHGSQRRWCVVAGTIYLFLMVGGTSQVAQAVVREERLSQAEEPRLHDPQSPHPGPLPGKGRGAVRSERPNQPAYVKGQLLVKFKSTGSHALRQCAHCLFANRTTLATAAADTSSSLDALAQQAGVTDIQPLFPQWHHREAAQAQGMAMAALAESRRSFPRRQARAPAGAEVPDLTHTYVLHVPEAANIEQLVQRYQADPHVAYAQPNYLMEVQMVPNDPYYSSSNSWGQGYDDLWGLKKIHAAEAWDVTQGEGIVVAVVDTGVDYTHPDITANIWTNPGETLDNGLDDDTNGFVDDVRGWDIADADNDPIDVNGHGTHVAGTIAAVGQNSQGVIGVAPHAMILPVKIFGSGNANFMSLAAQGIVYAAVNGADVINNSWGCVFPCPTNPVAEEAVRLAYGLGAVAVFAAMNSSTDATSISPQNRHDSKPLVVAASTPQDEATWFTNFGPPVDVSAPGGGTPDGPPAVEPLRNILSLKSTMCSGCPPALIIGAHYMREAGTSMATPHVAGLAALVLAHHPLFTNEEVRQVIRATTDPIRREQGKTFGTGRIHAARALDVNAVLRVQVTSPAVDAELSRADGVVTISGSAEGPTFQQYELATTSRDRSQWTPMTPPVPTPVHDGPLGTWGLTNMPTGFYLLHVAAATVAGFQFTDTVPVGVGFVASHRITYDPHNQLSPRISGQRIVWVDQRPGDGRPTGSPAICLYDLSTRSERKVTQESSDGVQLDPDINGDRITWTDFRHINPDGSQNAEIYLYDVTAGTSHRLTQNPFDQRQGAISGDLVVWEDVRDGQTELYLFDLVSQTERRVTNHPAHQFRPAIFGTRIVWQDTRHGPGEIYSCVYNSATGACPEERITTDPNVQENPRIAGDWIVWEDLRHGNGDLSRSHIPTRTERRVTTGPGSQFQPALSGDWLVWTDVPLKVCAGATSTRMTFVPPRHIY